MVAFMNVYIQGYIWVLQACSEYNRETNQEGGPGCFAQWRC